MQLLLVGGKSTDDENRTSLQELTQYITQTAAAEYAVAACHLDQLLFSIRPEDFELFDVANGIESKDIDGVYLRGPKLRLDSTYAYYVSQFCAQAGVPCVNSYGQYYPGTKFAQATVFRELGLPFLQTLYSIDKQLLITHAGQQLGYPYILKTNVGSHGDSNYLIKSADQAASIITAEPETDFLAQQYCPNDRDFRTLFIGDSHITFERRGAAGTHLNNTSKGALAQRVDEKIPVHIMNQARELSRRLGLQVSGVDVMQRLDSDEWYFLEINSQPQLRTGALLEEKQAELQTFLQEFLRRRAN